MLRVFQANKKYLSKGFNSSRILHKTIPFLLADIGEGIAEVEILEWHVKEGSKVEQFDKIAEVQSDKATVEITSRYDGVVRKIYHKKGSTAKVGLPLIDIETEGEAESVERATIKKDENKIATAKPDHDVKGNNFSETSQLPKINVKAMPGVRHLAKKLGIDIDYVNGTGNSKQVTKEDLMFYHSSTTDGKVNKSDNQGTVIPLNAFQKAMVKSMKLALTIPHFGYCEEISVDEIKKIRSELVPTFQEKYNVKLTNMAFYIKAISLCLNHFPSLNSHFDGEILKQFPAHNVCVAIDTEHGLAVPAVKNVEEKSILEIAKELGDLSNAARLNKLSQDKLTGGTITISNIGSIGGTTAHPVLLSPQVAIIALGRARTLPRFDDNMKVIPSSIMPISWSADHRVVDGATIAKFTQKWKNIIESPSELLLHLVKP